MIHHAKRTFRNRAIKKNESLSSSVLRARNELIRLENECKKDSDCSSEDIAMQQLVTDNVMELLRVFSHQGHSGFSANYVMNIFKQCVDGKVLTPLTGEDDEWKIADDSDETLEQNVRCSSVFRTNHDNSTAHYLNGIYFATKKEPTSWFSTKESSINITFPSLIPKTRYFILDNDSDDVSISEQLKNKTYTETY